MPVNGVFTYVKKLSRENAFLVTIMTQIPK